MDVQNIVVFFQKLAVYGCLGLIIEIFFTGIHSLVFNKDLAAKAQTYLWMIPIYGFTAIFLETLGKYLDFNPFINAAIYVPLIFFSEFISGLTIKKIIGRCPWDYGAAKFGIMGLIRLDYAPFWYVAALFLDIFRSWIEKFMIVAYTLIVG